MQAESGFHPEPPGDTLLMPAGEKHMTLNTGDEPLVLLCFFPIAGRHVRHHRIRELLNLRHGRACPGRKGMTWNRTEMTDVLCLRPQADFARVDALPPSTLAVAYQAPDDADVPTLMRKAQALVIPAVGPKLSPALFDGISLKLVQVTGAGLDRLDKAALTRLAFLSPMCLAAATARSPNTR